MKLKAINSKETLISVRILTDNLITVSTFGCNTLSIRSRITGVFDKNVIETLKKVFQCEAYFDPDHNDNIYITTYVDNAIAFAEPLFNADDEVIEVNCGFYLNTIKIEEED